jgi:4,5-dihydroxyphthalate decarboxylase
MAISVAMERYPFTTPILDGSVKPSGFEINAFTPEGGIVGAFRKMIREHAFDVCELGITTYLSAWDYGKEFTAIPIFLSYNFPQRNILCNLGSNIKEPKDLEGKRIGGRTYTVTALVWARGLLADVYGVDVDSITWVINDKEHVEAFEWPSNVEYLPGADLGAMLESGELDAGIGVFRGQSDKLAPLFADGAAAEREGYEKTGIYPINHVLTVADAALAANPALASELYDLFVEAKSQFMERLASGAELDEAEQALARRRDLVGPDPVPFGIEANRVSLDGVVRYSLEQKIVKGPLTVEEMFVPGVGA